MAAITTWLPDIRSGLEIKVIVDLDTLDVTFQTNRQDRWTTSERYYMISFARDWAVNQSQTFTPAKNRVD